LARKYVLYKYLGVVQSELESAIEAPFITSVVVGTAPSALPQAEIAKLLGVHWGSVLRWLTKWRRDGQSALKERKAAGRPPKLDCKRHGTAILKLVKHPATEFGYEHPLWTCQRIRQVISAELNLAVSVPTLWRELKKLKLSCQKPERRALEQDPKARGV
jgi:transposase